jgi:ABC-2 type transport system permease protein
VSVAPLTETAAAAVLGPDYLLALAAVAVLYLLLMLYGQWVAQGIIEEKSSRVVELLVSSMRPRELLAGKILGVGAIGLGQLALTALVGLGARLALGQQLPERAPETLGLVVAWYLLGYFLYATLFAVAGALVSRVEDLQSTALPLFVLIIGSFLVAQATAQDPSSTLATVAGLVPFTAPLVQPLLMAAGVADPLTAALAVLLCAGLIVGLVPLAARAYTGGVLKIGGRVKLREAMRADR